MSKSKFSFVLIYVILNNNQVGWFTCDNASSNDTCLAAFADIINTDKDAGATMWDPVQGHVRYVHRDTHPYVCTSHCLNRCMEHTINLAAGCFVTTVSPTSARQLLKKIKAAFKLAQLEGKDVDLDALEADLEDVDVEGDQEEDDDDDEEFEVGDTIGKALALVKQVCYLAALVSTD